MATIFILVGIVALVVIYFLVSSKNEQRQLKAKPRGKELPARHAAPDKRGEKPKAERPRPTEKADKGTDKAKAAQAKPEIRTASQPAGASDEEAEKEVTPQPPERQVPSAEPKPTVATIPDPTDAAAQRAAVPKPDKTPKPARADQAAAAAEAPPPAKKEKPTGRASLASTPDVERMRRGLARSRGTEGFFGKLRALFGGKREIQPDLAEDIEEVLLASDVGVRTTQVILDRVRQTLGKADLVDSKKVWAALREEATTILSCQGKAGSFELRTTPTVVLMVGVNGCGKTTTIGKLATRLQENGLRCVLAAGDTFRAAAVQQLVVWGKRIGCEVVRGKDGADPGSVIFDSIKKAEAAGADIVLADTAGRLHTKSNLMAEMKKIARTAGKALDGAPHEVLLVIDATTGQNALAQAKEFQEALNLTGMVLTKLDGTAKGGVILGICDSLQLPVRFVGLGERPDDLHEFSAEAFVEALLGRDTEANAA